MPLKKSPSLTERTVDDFLQGKSQTTVALFRHFVKAFQEIGDVILHPAKTMIGVATPQRRVSWITQLGKNFVHVVFPFRQAYPDNLCFIKIVQVPGDALQFNHHFRMYAPEDVNDEVQAFMRLALTNKA